MQSHRATVLYKQIMSDGIITITMSNGKYLNHGKLKTGIFIFIDLK